MVAWQQSDGFTEQLYQGLYVRRIGRDGVPIGGPIRVSATANSKARPRLASDGSRSLLVWTEGYYSAPEGRAALVSSGSVAPPFSLPDREQFDVVWNGHNYAVVGVTSGTISVTLVTRDGTGVTPTSSPFSGRDPRIATDGARHFVVWASGTNVMGAAFDANGNSVGSASTIDVDALGYATEEGPTVAWDGLSFVAVWMHGRDYVSFHDLLGRVIGSDGSLGDRFTLAGDPDDERAPAISGIGGGRSLVAYSRAARELSGAPRIFTRTLDANIRRRLVSH